MKTLIKMIMLGVLMTSGMVIAEGETAGGGDNYETGSFNFTENQNADINSVINGGNNYGDVQGAQNTYNCDVAGACSGSSISGGGSTGGGSTGGGGTTNGLEHMVNTATVVTQGAQIFHSVEQFSVPTHTVANGIFTAQPVYGLVPALNAEGNPILGASTMVDGVEVAGAQVLVTGITHYKSVEGTKTIALEGAPKVSTGFKMVATVDKYGNPTYEASTSEEVGVGKNSLDVQLEISKNQQHTTITQTVKSAPPVSAPQINANNADMCRTGISAGGSMIGMGFSAGITLVDKNCEMIKMVRLLNNLGLKDVALALLGQDSRVAAAMLQANAEYYGKFLSGTTRDLEAESNAAETAANGKVIEHDVIDEDTPSAEGFNLIDLLTKN